MPNRSTLALALLFIASACASRTSGVDDRYVAMLNSRLNGYRTDYVKLDSQTRAEVKSFSDFILVSHAPEETGTRLKSIADKILEVNEIRAEGTTLEKFLHEGAASGQIGLMAAWLQDQYRSVQEADQKSLAHARTFFSKGSVPGANWYREFESVLTERGTVKGEADELVKLSNDLTGYARDYGAAEQADQEAARRLSRGLMQMAAYYQTQAYMQQQNAFQQNLLASLNRPRSCWVNGAFIMCN